MVCYFLSQRWPPQNSEEYLDLGQKEPVLLTECVKLCELWSCRRQSHMASSTDCRFSRFPNLFLYSIEPSKMPATIFFSHDLRRRCHMTRRDNNSCFRSVKLLRALPFFHSSATEGCYRICNLAYFPFFSPHFTEHSSEMIT